MLAFNKTNKYNKNTDFVTSFLNNLKEWIYYITKNYYKNPKYRV